MLPRVDDVLKLLENGDWHDLEEIEKKIQLPSLDTASVTDFLAQYDFIKLDKERKKAKIDSSTQIFLKKIRRLEDEEQL
ncbi:MAG: hypothetical protein JSW19_04040 [Candidatus Bathyarchaeota archaeon]|nr:MAG: hypothetical protein JSW19_04040 [Candidatus Bathyarchaeota archaeon]